MALFLRTVQEDLETPCPVLHLCFTNFEHSSPNDPGREHRINEYRRIASILIPHCSQMRYLEASLDALSFSPTTDLIDLPNLRELRVWKQGLLALAPLLAHLPNLEVLSAIKFGDSGLYADDTHPPLDNIPMPTFRLRKLHLAQTDLTLAGCNWLLSSSRNMDRVVLQDIHENAESLGTVIHDSVLFLFLEGAGNSPHTGSDDLAGLVPRFKRLISLRISGGEWPWDSLLRNIIAPLKSIAISYSTSGITHLALRLDDRSWLPELETVTVHHWAVLDELWGFKAEDITNSRRRLEAACAGRRVEFVWTTEMVKGGSSRGEFILHSIPFT